MTRPPRPDTGPTTPRDRIAALRTAERRAERRHRLLVASVVTGVVAAIAAAVTVQAVRDGSSGPQGSPTGTVARYGFAVGSTDAPVTVTVYEDFLCPACGRFEQASGSTLEDLVDAGDVRVIYRPMAFLDHASTNRWSTRALNAAACAADTGAFAAVHHALFAAQPAEGGPGPEDDELIALASDAGADDPAFAACVRDLRFEQWTRDATDAASKDGIVATPTVLVDGTTLPNPTTEALLEAIAEAGADTGS